MNQKKLLVSLTIAVATLIGTLFVASSTFAALLDASSFKFDGYYRVRQIYFHDLTVYQNPLNTSYFDQRFRLEPQLNVNEDIVIKSQIDMLDDVLWGDNVDPDNSINTGNPSNNSAYYPYGVTTSDGTSLLNINVKRVWLEYNSPFGQFSIGRMPYGFGLGVLYNNGDGFKNEWGDAYYGNTADQIQFATMPMGKEGPLITVLNYAKIKTNNISNTYDDDDWYTFIPGFTNKKATVLLLLQHQEQNSFKKNINLAELYADITPIENLKILVDYFYISGHIMPFLAGTPSATTLKGVIGSDELKVMDAQGGVIRGSYSMSPMEYDLEIGFSPANGTAKNGIETYPFSNDYNSSLILFNNTGLGAPNIFENPTLAGLNMIAGPNNQIPPQSALKDDFIYIAPMVKFIPADFLKMKLQYLYAETNDFTNYADLMGRQAGKNARDLGNEVDFGVDTTLSDKFIFGFQTGYFMPGAVFKDANNYAASIFSFQTRFTVLF